MKKFLLIFMLPLVVMAQRNGSYPSQGGGGSSGNFSGTFTGNGTFTNINAGQIVGIPDTNGNSNLRLAGAVTLVSTNIFGPLGNGRTTMLWYDGTNLFGLLDPEYHDNQNILYISSGLNGEQSFDAASIAVNNTNNSGQTIGSQLGPRITLMFKAVGGSYSSGWRFEPYDLTLSTPNNFGTNWPSSSSNTYEIFLQHNNTNTMTWGARGWTNYFGGGGSNDFHIGDGSGLTNFLFCNVIKTNSTAEGYVAPAYTTLTNLTGASTSGFLVSSKDTTGNITNLIGGVYSIEYSCQAYGSSSAATFFLSLLIMCRPALKPKATVHYRI